MPAETMPARPRLATAAVVVLAKDPVPGKVKTRLQSRFTPDQAADLAAAAIDDTFAAIGASFAGRVIAAWDGESQQAIPAGVEVVRQPEGSLDVRIEAALDATLRRCDGPAVLVGMDTPQLSAADLDLDWSSTDAVLGPTPDGGFWALGLASWVPGCVVGVPMSTSTTGQAQLQRLRDLGLRVRLLPELEDVDTPDVAQRVAAGWPSLRFSARYRALVGR